MPAAQKKKSTSTRKKTTTKTQSKARPPKATTYGDAYANRVQNLVIVFAVLSIAFAVAAIIRYS